MYFQKNFSIQIHPILIFAFSLIIGIALQAYTHKALFLVSIMLIIVFLFILFFYKKVSTTFYLFLGIITGILSYTMQITHHENYASHITNNQSFDIIAKVIDKEHIENSYAKQALTLSICQINNHQTHAIIPISGTALAYSTLLLELEPDDIIKISNVWPKVQKNDSFAHYLLKEGINFTFFINNHNHPEILHKPHYSFKRWLFNKKISLLKMAKQKMSFMCYTLFSSLFLGNKKINKKYFATLKEQFKHWGLSHYLARSGLHLMIFIIIFSFLLRMLPLSFFLKKIILLFSCLIYYIFSWSSISFIRALFTYCCYCFYSIFNYQINALHLLCLVTIGILCFNPLQLFFLDFQLSFMLTFGLACIKQSKFPKHMTL